MNPHVPPRQSIVKTYAKTLVLMAPLFGLLAYAYWEGHPPAPERWVTGYRWAGIVAALELGLALSAVLKMSRLVVGVLMYLIVGSALAWLGLYRELAYVGGDLRGSGVIISILIVGIVSTVATRDGFIGVPLGSSSSQRRASLQLLGVAAAAAVFSYLMRDSRWLGTGLPLLVIFASHRLIIGWTLRASMIAAMRTAGDAAARTHVGRSAA